MMLIYIELIVEILEIFIWIYDDDDDDDGDGDQKTCAKHVGGDAVAVRAQCWVANIVGNNWNLWIIMWQ